MRRGLVALALLAMGCANDSAAPRGVVPTAPTSLPVPNGPTVTLTGLVTESGRPVASAWVGATPLRSTSGWYGSPRRTQTDASGRYQLSNLPEHADVVYITASKDDYVQQCAVSVTLQADTSVDLVLTALPNIITNGLPVLPIRRQVNGVVYERTPNGRRPVATCGSAGNPLWTWPWQIHGQTLRGNIDSVACRATPASTACLLSGLGAIAPYTRTSSRAATWSLISSCPDILSAARPLGRQRQAYRRCDHQIRGNRRDVT
jgi:hypothetical protein